MQRSSTPLFYPPTEVSGLLWGPAPHPQRRQASLPLPTASSRCPTFTLLSRGECPPSQGGPAAAVTSSPIQVLTPPPTLQTIFPLPALTRVKSARSPAVRATAWSLHIILQQQQLCQTRPPLLQTELPCLPVEIVAVWDGMLPPLTTARQMHWASWSRLSSQIWQPCKWLAVLRLLPHPLLVPGLKVPQYPR